MKCTDTIIPGAKSLNNYQTDQISSGIDFSQKQITTNTKLERKNFTRVGCLTKTPSFFASGFLKIN